MFFVKRKILLQCGKSKQTKSSKNSRAFKSSYLSIDNSLIDRYYLHNYRKIVPTREIQQLQLQILENKNKSSASIEENQFNCEFQKCVAFSFFNFFHESKCF